MSINEHDPVPAEPCPFCTNCSACGGTGVRTPKSCQRGEHDWEHTVGVVDGKVTVLIGQSKGVEVVGRGYPDWTDQWICRGCNAMRFAPEIHNQPALAASDERSVGS